MLRAALPVLRARGVRTKEGAEARNMINRNSRARGRGNGLLVEQGQEEVDKGRGSVTIAPEEEAAGRDNVVIALVEEEGQEGRDNVVLAPAEDLGAAIAAPDARPATTPRPSTLPLHPRAATSPLSLRPSAKSAPMSSSPRFLLRLRILGRRRPLWLVGG